MRKIIYFLFALVLISCGKEDVLMPKEPKYDLSKPVADKNVAYGSDKENVMDIYLPANRSTTNTKVILLFHGGAWTNLSGGDKNDEEFAPIVDSIRKRLPDWAIFNLNYRLATLSGKNTFPVQEQDVATAVKFIFDNRQAYGISNKWVLAGASAGAHLAMLQAYKNNTPIKPKAVVNFFGPNDLISLHNSYTNSNNPNDKFRLSGLNMLLNGTPSSNEPLYKSSSPITYVSTAVPTIILHGGNDDVVPVGQSVALRNKLEAAGITNKYADYLREQTHGWSDPAIWVKCLNDIQSFLNTNVP